MTTATKEAKIHTDKKGNVTGMKVIAIEGLDKSGKRTALDVLYDYFTSKGLRVERMSFPNYNHPIGQLIQKWLTGNYLADEKTFELLHAADKQQMQFYIKEYERKGVDILLIDRYVHSQLAYGAYDSDDTWLAELARYIRKPDAVIYLDVEPEVSMHRRGKYGDNDYYESDIERLRYTKSEYECLFKEETDSAVHMVDANQPPIIVKFGVLKVGALLYEQYTGNASNVQDMSRQLTDEEAYAITRWSQAIDRSGRCVH